MFAFLSSRRMFAIALTTYGRTLCRSASTRGFANCESA